MESYVKCVEVTEAYAEAFNRRDLASIARLLDREVISSSQRRQGVAIGREQVLRRIKSLWQSADNKDVTLKAHTGLVQIGEIASHPCMVVFKDKRPMSALVLEVNKGGMAYMLSAMVHKEFIKKIRLVDKDRTRKKV